MSEIDWEDFKKRLDIAYRYHYGNNNLIAMRILDGIYTLYERGNRDTIMVKELEEIEEYVVS